MKIAPGSTFAIDIAPLLVLRLHPSAALPPRSRYIVRVSFTATSFTFAPLS